MAKPAVEKDMIAANQTGEAKFKEIVEEKVVSDKPDLFTTITRTNLKRSTKKQIRSQISTKTGKVFELRPR